MSRIAITVLGAFAVLISGPGLLGAMRRRREQARATLWTR